MRTKVMIVLLASAFVLTQTGCKKTTQNNSLDPEVQQLNTDASNCKTELDQADNDINDMVGKTSMGQGGGGWGSSSPLCGVTIDTSQVASKIVTFHFDGTTECFSPSRTRSGKIIVKLTSGNRWGDVGSVLTETFVDYKITRSSDNKSIMFNGVKTYKNMNGNNWLGFFLSTSNLKYQERALNIQVTFDHNQTAVWNSARVTEWHFTKGNVNPAIPYDHLVFTASGDTAVNGFSNVDSWGVNRLITNFTTYYKAPINSNNYCGLWRFNAGELVHHVNNTDFSFLLGVDKYGAPSTGTCAYGFKVTWTSAGSSGNVVLSY